MEKATMDDSARHQLLVFLSGRDDESSYSPGTDQIIGVLKQMGAEMAGGLADATKQEADAQATYDEMMETKTKEENILTAQIEEEMMKLGEMKVLLAEDGNDLEETKATLQEDTTYLAELKKGCSTKSAEWEERCKLRQEELVALSETIKVLNNDEA